MYRHKRIFRTDIITTIERKNNSDRPPTKKSKTSIIFNGISLIQDVPIDSSRVPGPRRSITEDKSNRESWLRFETHSISLVASCLQCEERKTNRIIKRTGGNASDLKKHLKSYHSMAY